MFELKRYYYSFIFLSALIFRKLDNITFIAIKTEYERLIRNLPTENWIFPEIIPVTIYSFIVDDKNSFNLGIKRIEKIKGNEQKWQKEIKILKTLIGIDFA